MQSVEPGLNQGAQSDPEHTHTLAHTDCSPEGNYTIEMKNTHIEGKKKEFTGEKDHYVIQSTSSQP